MPHDSLMRHARGLLSALRGYARSETLRARVGTVFSTLLLRVITLASKLLLMVALARWLTPAEMAEYGLLVATASVGMTIAGLEIYSITARQIVKSPDEHKARVLRDQFVAFPIVHLALGLVAFVAVRAGLLEPAVAATIWMLIVIENISHECFRVLIVLGRPVVANWVLFIRTGAWAFLLVGLFWTFPSWRTLGLVVALWLLSGTLSIGLALWSVRDLPWGTTRGRPVDWRWLGASIAKGWPFMSSAVLALVLAYGDRYVLTGLVDRNALGVFTLYSTLAIAVSSLATTAVSQHFLPRVIDAAQTSLMEFRGSLRRFAVANLLFVTALVLVALPAIHVVVFVVGNPIYATELETYYALTVAAGLRSLTDVPSYALYAGHKDRTLLATNMIAAVISISASLLLIPSFGIKGAAIAALLASTSLYVLQAVMAAFMLRTLHRRDAAPMRT